MSISSNGDSITVAKEAGLWVPHPVKGIVYDNQVLMNHVDFIAGVMNDTLADKNPVFVVVMKGAMTFATHLMERLRFEFQMGVLTVGSYGDGGVVKSGIRVYNDLRIPIPDRFVVVIEDIIDTGGTLTFLEGFLKLKNPASLMAVSLTSKQANLPSIVPADYPALPIDPKKWVIGFGLDYKESYRFLPYIGWMDPQ